jgi:hypothetical protein
MFVGHAPLTGRTFREIADDLGLPLETLTRLYTMWGLPRPDPGDVVRAPAQAGPGHPGGRGRHTGRARFRGLGPVELKGIAAAVELSAAGPPVDSG